ncbi:MAG: amidase [Alphaproteobacteria bacterium]
MKANDDRPLAEIAAGLRDGTIAARDLIERAIANYARTGESLGAYKIWDSAAGRKAAELADRAFAAHYDLGPLQGIPVSVKDLFGLTGWPIFAGSPTRLPTKWERDGRLVQTLRRQLAVVAGKTHTVEFAYGAVGVNPHWETPINPWGADAPRVPGGSSSGAGVSLATGTAFVALGTDTAGSVRIPASMTGTVGLKTTFGRWPTDGVLPISPSLDTTGILTRTVADAAYAFRALDPMHVNNASPAAGTQPADPAYLRIGVPEGAIWDGCSPGIAEGVRTALDEFSRAGARLVPFAFPEFDRIAPMFLKGGLTPPEFYEFLSAELPDWLPKLDPVIRQRMNDAVNLPAHEYLARKRVIREAAASIDARLGTIDVVAFPSVVVTPPAIDAMSKVENYRPAHLGAARNNAFASYLGLCAISMPVALDAAAMPVGLQLMARGHHEDALLGAALAAEKILGTARQRLGVPPRGI